MKIKIFFFTDKKKIIENPQKTQENFHFQFHFAWKILLRNIKKNCMLLGRFLYFFFSFILFVDLMPFDGLPFFSIVCQRKTQLTTETDPKSNNPNLFQFSFLNLFGKFITILYNQFSFLSSHWYDFSPIVFFSISM
jgi:hypothetical protein